VPPLVTARTASAFKDEGIPRFWNKYGIGITLGEARNQDQVAQIVKADPASAVRAPKVYLVFLHNRCVDTSLCSTSQAIQSRVAG